MIGIALCAVIIIIGYLYQRQKSKFKYWDRLSVPNSSPHNLIFGSIAQTITGKSSLLSIINDEYAKYKNQGARYFGMYIGSIPTLVPIDIELIKNIMIKDFNHFVDRGVTIKGDKEPLNVHMFFLKGKAWTERRQKFSPLFTSVKLKNLMPIIEPHIDLLTKALNEHPSKEVPFINYCTSLGIDLIGHIAFGLDCNTLKKENMLFKEMSDRIFCPKPFEALKLFLTDMQSGADILRLTASDQKMCKYFFNLIEDTIKYRKANDIKTKDLLQAMMEVVNEDDPNYVKSITAEAFLFFIAGFETFTISTTYVLYELAKKQEIQEELRNEIMEHLESNEGRFAYDFVMNNKLLDRVVKEGMRIHPPGIYTFRECGMDYPIPNSDYVIKKGTHILIPIYAVHHDAEHHPDPETFNPDRFDNVKTASCTYLPFGEGPRLCIARSLGLLETKFVIVKMLSKFALELSPKCKGKPLTINRQHTSMVLQYNEDVTFTLKNL